MADVLSWVTTQLDPDTVGSIIDGVTLGTAHWAELHDSSIVEGNHCLGQGICVTACCTLVQMHVTDWAEAQKEDLLLSVVLDWLKAQKKTDWKALLAEHASSEQADLMESAEFYDSSRTLVPVLNAQRWDWRSSTLHGPQGPLCCHLEWVPQGCDHTLSLLQECFWLPGMTNQMQQSTKSFTHCLQHEGNLSKVPLHQIVATTPMDLLDVNFTSIKMTLELNRPPKVENVLVFQDHFMKHVMGHMTPNQTAKTVAKFMWLHLNLWGPSQAPELFGYELQEQHYGWDV